MNVAAAGVPHFTVVGDQTKNVSPGSIDFISRNWEKTVYLPSYLYPLMDRPNITLLTGALAREYYSMVKRDGY